MDMKLSRRLAGATLVLVGVFNGAAAAELDIFSAPASVSVGQDFTVSVYVNGITNLYGYEFDLGFNSALVQALGETEGSFLSQGGTLPTFHIPGAIDNFNGVVASVGNSLLGPATGVDGSGTLETFEFKAVATGSASFELANAILVDNNLNDITPPVVGTTTTVTPGTTTVPEPGAVGLFALGAMAALRRRR